MRICAANKKFCLAYFQNFLLKIRGEGKKMWNENEENGAAKKAWELFEKTGKISYYMLYHDLRKKR